MTDIPKLSAALADRYRIERELGQGGMATVYLAHDVKHDRKVALKVLRPELAAVLGADRFVQEIKTTAALQHPHILPLFDSGEANGFLYYVMPYVAGETLRDKLNRETQLGVEEAVKITTDVADALDYAHGQNVIHRDIKPENILLHNGRPMVVDFGIALAVSAAAGGRMTETGLSLGTPHYMSPEQATAEKNLTNRSDIYSLGAMLYEMLAGDPPHVGSSAHQIIMKIVTEEAPLVTSARKSVPPNVAAATAKALQKLPADRFESAAAFAEALRNPSFALAQAPSTLAAQAATSGRLEAVRWKRLSIAMIAVSALLLVGLLWSIRLPRLLPSYDVGFSAAHPMSFTFRRSFSVAPSGDFVVYNSGADSGTTIWYRSLRNEELRPIRGSRGSLARPLLSPDATRLAFLVAVETGVELRMVPVGGGEGRVIAELDNPDLVEWTSDGQILVLEYDGVALKWFDPAGGETRSIATPYCINPSRAGESELVLCGGGGSKYGRVIDLADATVHLLRSRSDREDRGSGAPVRGTNLQLVDDDYLVYLSLEGDLRATSIDLESFTVGRSVTLVSGVHYESYSGSGDFQITPDGTLFYASGPPSNVGQFVQADRAGAIRELPVPSAAFLRWDLSPDGRRLVAAVEGTDGQELHVYDLDSGRRHTWLEGAFIGHPRWSPDGSRVLVSIQPHPESSDAALLLGSPTAAAAPDTIARLALSIGSYFADSLVIADHGGGAVGVGVRLDLRTSPVSVDTIGNEVFAPSLSPDGKWFAYDDRVSLVIEPWPGRNQRSRLVNLSDAQWTSATELAGWSIAAAQWYRVSVDANAEQPVGEPRFWFEDPKFSDTPGASHVATPDGGVIYMRGPDQRVAHYIRVVPGWVGQMKRAVNEANR